jgi:hypothetical protein
MRSTSVPKYEKNPPAPLDIRTSPTPAVSANDIPAVSFHAFICATMRLRKSAGVLSMKLTVSCRGTGPQNFVVSTAIFCGSMI